MNTRKRVTWVFVLILASLMLAACGSSVDLSDYQPGACDTGTIALPANESMQGQVSGGAYPNNCVIYCLWVPEGGNQMDITISGFDEDLDMYVDQSLGILQEDDFGQWYSNDAGSGNESVNIEGPGGRYYIQVCSYEGTPSSFTIDSNYR